MEKEPVIILMLTEANLYELHTRGFSEGLIPLGSSDTQKVSVSCYYHSAHSIGEETETQTPCPNCISSLGVQTVENYTCAKSFQFCTLTSRKCGSKHTFEEITQRKPWKQLAIKTIEWRHNICVIIVSELETEINTKKKQYNFPYIKELTLQMQAEHCDHVQRKKQNYQP